MQISQQKFLSQWMSIQIVGSICLAIATQGFVTSIALISNIDNPIAIGCLRILACILTDATLGYLQWHLLKSIVKTLDRRWMYTAMVGLPINILNWGLIHLGIDRLLLDEDGTVFIILAIVGAIIGGCNGHIIGTLQKSLFKKSLYWRSLWHDWDREQILAGALGGIVSAVTIIAVVFLFGWNWLSLPISAFLCSIGLASISQVMYGLIVGDTIQDVFKQAKLIQ